VSGFGVLVRKELLEQWRTFRLPVVALVFLLTGLGSPLLARFTPEIVKAVAGDQIPIPLPAPTTAAAVDQLLKNLLQFGALAAILLAMGAVATEKERGTAALILTSPASRGAFLAAKVVALGSTLAAATALALAAAWVYTALLFEPLPLPGFLGLGALAWLTLVAYGSFTFLGSTVTRSPVAAGALGFGAFLGLSILSALPRVADYLPGGLAGPARAVALGETPVDVAAPLVGTLVLIAVTLGGAWLAFRRQEL